MSQIQDAPQDARPPQRWRPTRSYKIAGGVVAAYVAFAGFAQLIGEDKTASDTSLARDVVVCQAVNSYEQALAMMSGEAGNFGDVMIGDVYEAVELAPEQYREELRYLVEGLDRASYGELSEPSDLEPYLEAHADLERDTASYCRDVLGEADQRE